MHICRFNKNRLGAVVDGAVVDMTDVIETLPAETWPTAPGDFMIRNLPAIKAFANANIEGRPRLEIDSVHLNCPVTHPTKVIAAPLNYWTHVDEVNADKAIHNNVFNTSFQGYKTPIDKLGLFLKANSSLCGPSDGVALIQPDRRNDHEVELAVIIGKTGKNIAAENADDYIAAYSIGLDMTVRGPEDRSFRKSPDSYTVIGPYLTFPEDVRSRDDLAFWIKVNGKIRQESRTRHLIVGIAELISLASRWYTLFPGDIILTGTPDGVGAVQSGDRIEAWIDQIGSLSVGVL